MTLSEFKAWFEGYTEGLEGAPTKAQFDRIKEKVKEISGTPTSYPIFVDRYRQWVQPNQWGSPYVNYSVGAVGQVTGNAVLMNQGLNQTQNPPQIRDRCFGSRAILMSAFTDLKPELYSRLTFRKPDY